MTSAQIWGTDGMWHHDYTVIQPISGWLRIVAMLVARHSAPAHVRIVRDGEVLIEW